MLSTSTLLSVALWLDIGHANFFDSSFTSSWGVDYVRLDFGTELASATVWRANKNTQQKTYAPGNTPPFIEYNDSDLEFGSISHLYDDGNPDHNPPADADIAGNIDLTTVYDRCKRLADYTRQNDGLIFEFNLTGTYDLYKAQVSFAYDGGGNGIQLPANPTWIEAYALDFHSHADPEQRTLVTLNSTQSDWFDDSNLFTANDWLYWETDDLTDESQVVLTDSVQLYVGNRGSSSYEGINWAYVVCEITLYGRFVTAAPTNQPTMAPVHPTPSPTAAPTFSPTVAPTAAPSYAPTEDACPNFNVRQPCCANRGGFRYNNNTYDLVTGALVTDAASCFYVFDNQQCCGNGSYAMESIATQIDCLVDDVVVSGPDAVCNASLLTRETTFPWYGFDVVNGTNTEYTPRTLPALPDCACSYVIQVCETRVDLECLTVGDEVARNPPDHVLCASNTSNVASAAVFVAGGETDLLSFVDVVQDTDTGVCQCNYIADNCLDDIAYRDDFDIPGNLDDNDTCTINYIYDCCPESGLAFGGVAISSLDLATYASLAADSRNDWRCENGNADLCDFEGIPPAPDAQQQFFSWLYNEYDAGAAGFVVDTVCECHLAYNNCTTAAPTQTTNAPSVSPTTDPTTQPTLAPTFYQFDDYNDTQVTQPCCGAANVTIVNSQCNTDLDPPCTIGRFQGESGQIQVAATVDETGNCSCFFDVGFWDWQIPETPQFDVDALQLDVTTWTEIVRNVSWENSTFIDALLLAANSISSGGDNGTRRRRRLQQSPLDIDCIDVYVTDCDVDNACPSQLQPTLTENDRLQNIGRTFETWTDFSGVLDDAAQLVETCFCYWMFFACYVPPTTTMSPTTAAPTTTPSPTASPTVPITEQARSFVEANFTIVVVGGICIGLLVCLCIALCIISYRKRKKADSAERNMEKDSSSPDAPGQTKPVMLDQDRVNSANSDDDVLRSDYVTPAAADIVQPAPPKNKVTVSPKSSSAAGAIELQRVDAEDAIDIDEVDLTYMAEFTAKPFGFAFGTDPDKRDKHNLYVTEVDIDSVAEQLHVMVGSYVVAFGDETVEGQGAKKIFEIFKEKYADQIPLPMVFKQCNPGAVAAANGEHLYSVLFTKSPFGIKFGKNANDARNLYVDHIEAGSIAAQLQVQTGSKVVQFESERVEGMGRKKVFGVFREKYAKQLPLRVVFCSPPTLESGDEDGEGAGLMAADAAATAAAQHQPRDEDEKLPEDMYAVTFTERPFGFTFGKDKSDPDNLFVTQLDDDGQAQRLGVLMSSKIVRFEEETVEGIGSTNGFKIYQKKFAKKLPLKVVLLKPPSQGEGDGHAMLMTPDMYEVQFTERPFGASFGKDKSDPKNLYVTVVDDDGHAQELNVLVGSRIIRFENENVEGIGAKQVFQVFTKKYKDALPLTIVFRKPDEQEQGMPPSISPPDAAADGEGDDEEEEEESDDGGLYAEQPAAAAEEEEDPFSDADMPPPPIPPVPADASDDDGNDAPAPPVPPVPAIPPMEQKENQHADGDDDDEYEYEEEEEPVQQGHEKGDTVVHHADDSYAPTQSEIPEQADMYDGDDGNEEEHNDDDGDYEYYDADPDGFAQ